MSQEKELKRIADAFDKIAKIYEDPTAYLESISQGISGVVSRVQMPAMVEGGAPCPPGAMITGVAVSLSEEERKAICERAMADIEEQMTEFKGFIG
ncbi:hypothetical protein ES703_90178 [subsurface metagenome]